MIQEQYPKGKHVQSKQGNGEVGCGNPVHGWLAAAGGMKRSAANSDRSVLAARHSHAHLQPRQDSG